MKDHELDELFQNLNLDIAEPAKDHRERFQEKLDRQSKKKLKSSGIISLWIPALSIAASFLVAFFLLQGVLTGQYDQLGGLASVSTEMANTQNFYSSVIKQELTNLEKEKSPETEKLIEDALNQLEILERDYENLKTDLMKSGNDKRVIYAMISNFQQRIDLLNQVLEKANDINELKNVPHENNYL